MEHIFIRGGSVRWGQAAVESLQGGTDQGTLHMLTSLGSCRFMTIPDMLKNAPMFKRIDPKYKVSPSLYQYRMPLWVCICGYAWEETEGGERERERER